MTEQQKLTFNMLQQQLDSLMLRDRQRFARRLHGVKKVKNPDAQQAIFQEMAKEIDHAAGKVLLREAARPEITYPDNLPVSQKKQDILEAIREHQVVIVAGETGSGKTTLYKLLILQAALKRQPLILIDPKNDEELADYMYKCMKLMEREDDFYYLSIDFFIEKDL